MMDKFVTVQDRKFKIIRVCKEQNTTDDVREIIKLNNLLIDVVLRDGSGNLLFCHEIRDAIIANTDTAIYKELEENDTEEPQAE